MYCSIHLLDKLSNRSRISVAARIRCPSRLRQSKSDVGVVSSIATHTGVCSAAEAVRKDTPAVNGRVILLHAPSKLGNRREYAAPAKRSRTLDADTSPAASLEQALQ